MRLLRGVLINLRYVFYWRKRRMDPTSVFGAGAKSIRIGLMAASSPTADLGAECSEGRLSQTRVRELAQ